MNIPHRIDHMLSTNDLTLYIEEKYKNNISINTINNILLNLLKSYTFEYKIRVVNLNYSDNIWYGVICLKNYLDVTDRNIYEVKINIVYNTIRYKLQQRIKTNNILTRYK